MTSTAVVIIDHPDDPAWKTVTETLGDASAFWGMVTETAWLATGLLVYLTVRQGMLTFLERREGRSFHANPSYHEFRKSFRC